MNKPARPEYLKRVRRDNKLGVRGVYYDEFKRRYVVQKTIKGIRRQLGYTSTLEEAKKCMGSRDIPKPADTTGPNYSVDQVALCLVSASDATEAVHGLLCWNCNVGLGHFRDCPTRLKAAHSYLRESASIGDCNREPNVNPSGPKPSGTRI